jgi:antagonist of KipI
MALQYAEPATIRVLRGAQFDWLDDDSQRGLFSTEFEVTNQSDRMGFRLAGPKLRLARQSELISEAVCGGTIQLPPEGQPILLMADCATTGGYAKIAHVAAVDLPLIAQVRPGGRIRFVEISVSEAQALFLAREALIARLKIGLDFQAHE